VTLKDNETGKLMIRASHGLSETEKLRGVYRQDEGVTGHIFQSGQPLMVPDISKEPLFLDKTRSRRIEKGPISFIGVPISLHGKPIGVLNVDRLFGAEISPEEDIQFLTIVSALIAQFVSLNLQVEAREKSLKRENRSLKAELSEKYNHFFIVGTSPAMMAVQNLIEKVAPSKASILLLGESGTGKTLIARIIHEMSDRAEGPFAKLNCATLPENLLESELFGHERGAFTGATSAKPGRMEEADGGTIFMDEIGELPLSLQAKLLRFLQEREFERLGSTKTRKVDVRIIAATNRDLSKAIQEGGFREDLYYRLNVFPIQVPPLRERREDILPLIDYFSEKFSKEYVKTLRFTPEAFGVLLNYRWSGNVRELENLMERLAILIEDSHINVTDLPPELIESSRNPEGPPAEAGAASAPFASCSLEDMEKREVMAALERHNWNQSRAAKELGLTLRQVGYRLKKYNLEELVRERRTLRSRP
jgi:Nif-specific regulatory protein